MVIIMNGLVAQALAATLACLVMVSAGMLFGWASPSMPLLLAEDSSLPLTADQGSWVVSLLSFGAVFGPLLVLLLVDRIGRKWTLNVAVLPVLISWPMIAFADSYELLCAARFIGGLGLGAAYSITPMYVGEIADDKIRGGLGSMIASMMYVGLVIAYSTGPWVSRQWLALISAIPAIVVLLTVVWIPETSYYLLMKGKRDAAHSSLMWFRRREDVTEELDSIEHNVRLQQRNKSNVFDLVKNPGNRKAFLILFGLITAQQLSGTIAIQSYASSIFEQSGFAVSSSVSVIIMGVVKLIATFCAVFTVDAAGRRPILMFSTIGSCLFLAMEGVFYHLQALDYDVSGITWIPLTGIIGFCITFTPGLGCLPYMILAELFPTNVKALAITLISMYGSLAGVVITKLYQVVADGFGTHVAFYAFAVSTAFSLIFVIFGVPETKGRSLQDIQDMLNERAPTK